jgi:glucose-6-phosphate 1-epimerase
VVSLHAGQVLSFRPTGTPHDLLFVSEAAYYQAGKAIKGGVPVCWPWFGADPEGLGRAAHGFVRNRPWTVAATAAHGDGDTRLTLALADSPDTRSIWPHAFNLTLEITVADALTLALVTRNTGSEPFAITQALHTYFNVGDIHQVKVLGLENGAYLDKAGDGGQKIQTGPVTIAAEVDRIYTDVASELTIIDPSLARRIRIAARGSRTAVVWNPWADIAAQMADLKDDDYLRFVCVETANAAGDVIQVPANSEYRLQTSYSIEAGVAGAN